MGGFDGLPFEIVEVLPPARWHGFARRRVEKVIFVWGTDVAGSRRTVATSLEEERWVWRGFSPRARIHRVEPLQSGLMPGAQAVPVEVGDEDG